MDKFVFKCKRKAATQLSSDNSKHSKKDTQLSLFNNDHLLDSKTIGELLDKKQKELDKGLKLLIYENKNGISKCVKTKTGYAFSIDNKKWKGATRTLKTAFYSNYRDFKERRRCKHSSSRKLGTNFHQQLAHQLHCKKLLSSKKNSKIMCCCEKEFGKKPKKPRTGSRNEYYVNSFLEFLKSQGLRHCLSEQCVLWKEINCATAIDMLCVNNLDYPTKLWLFEFKTGYAVQKDTPRTQEQKNNKKNPHTGMQASCVRDIECTISNQHQLQAWFGVQALKSRYNLEVDNAVVVYFYTKPSGEHAVEYRYAEKWWWGNEKRTLNMINAINNIN